MLVSTSLVWSSEVKELGIYRRAEKAMWDEGLAKSEHVLRLGLLDDPSDDRARFQMGIVQFFRAVENLGQGLYQYGLDSQQSNAVFMRLPVPKNRNPSEIDHPSFLRLIDSFSGDLMKAERTLAAVEDDRVKAPLHLGKVKFQFSGRENISTSLMEVIKLLPGRGMEVAENNPEFLVHFDRGDVAWLRSYCHVFAGLVDVYHSFDSTAWFDRLSPQVFPRVKTLKEPSDDSLNELRLLDAVRLHQFRLHMLAVTDLNAETWRHIRSETDNDHEWLPNANQTDQLGVPLSDQQIDAWLSMMSHMHGIFTGERLVPSGLLQFIYPGSERGMGFNVANFLDDAPPNLDYQRILADGINEKYLEPEEGREVVDVMVLWRVGSLFSGQFGVFSAIRMN